MTDKLDYRCSLPSKFCSAAGRAFFLLLLSQKVSRIQFEVEILQGVSTALGHQACGKDHGFRPYLCGLSQHIWL
ncbi:hypothetical protein N9747_03125 [Planktomarina sp.]|nr:hypothetical protein [Planktomarina sp.]